MLYYDVHLGLSQRSILCSITRCLTKLLISEYFEVTLVCAVDGDDTLCCFDVDKITYTGFFCQIYRTYHGLALNADGGINFE